MTRFYQVIAARSWRLALLAMLTTLPACATVDKSDPKATRTHYTLRYGEATKAEWPLPTMTPIYIDWHHIDGRVESIMGFRSYDMNRDGTMDYLEILSDDGKVHASLSDFDFDGRPDQPIEAQTKN